MRSSHHSIRERRCLAALAALAALLPGCAWDGHFSLLGYTTRPNYDPNIRTVFVHNVRNVTLQRGIEFDLQRAVIREIEAKTPYKVASSLANADSELMLKIISDQKTIINMNQIGEIREAQNIMTAELVWRDLRPGHVGELLSAPRQGGIPVPPVPLDPKAPPPPPVLVSSYGTFIPELGSSRTTAEQENVNKMATQIVSMMEFWPATPQPQIGFSP